MARVKCVCFIGAAALAVTVNALGILGQSEVPASSTPVFRANARLVQVDVVVTDRSGNSITGLQKSDFTVLQDGKMKSITVFEPHTRPRSASTPGDSPKLKPPPDTYSNQPPLATDQGWNIVLYDIHRRASPPLRVPRR